MSSLKGVLDTLGIALPVLAAPMAGGPTTPALVASAARAGSFGFLAAGYLTAEAFAAQVEAVRAQTPTFGVNLFAPNPLPVEPAEFRGYADRLQTEADVYGLDLTQVRPIEDDDSWHDKIQVLLSDPVPLASFTFGIPAADVIAALRGAGTLVLQTVTSPGEARQALEAGVDGLVVQAATAGGHSGTLTPSVLPEVIALPELVAAIRATTAAPIIAGGGTGSTADVAAAIHAGADAVAVGTLLLLADEAGTSAPYRAALQDPSRTETVVTRAFTGRPARGLRNLFTDRYTDDAPSGYPALHHLTRPVRRAAAEAGDPERINLWAGTGKAGIREGSAADILTALSAAL